MKLFVCVLLLVLALDGAFAVKCTGTSVDKGTGTYSTRYDNVDVDAILNSSRLLKQYVDCVLDRGSCTQEGCFLKEVIPDALGSDCSKCNEKQKKIAGKILGYLLQYHRKDYWPDLISRFDKDGNLRKKYEFEEDDEERRRR
ncbi:allergen Tha p 1 [Anabrus simplex]|uniref:allergen Tha p 1 n=1 Tax=Anabrus simplex TaxID=316456 RepID=UPI0035A36942